VNLKNLEKNITVATKVAAKLDTSVASTAHDFLVVIYKKFPILAYNSKWRFKINSKNSHKI